MAIIGLAGSSWTPVSFPSLLILRRTVGSVQHWQPGMSPRGLRDRSTRGRPLETMDHMTVEKNRVIVDWSLAGSLE